MGESHFLMLCSTFVERRRKGIERLENQVIGWSDRLEKLKDVRLRVWDMILGLSRLGFEEGGEKLEAWRVMTHCK